MALREILAKFGFQLDNRNLTAADKSIAGVISQFQAFGAVIAGAAIVQGVARFVGDVVKMGDELGDSAAKLGVSAQQLQKWRAAVDFAGGETSALDGAMRVLSKSAFEAGEKGGEAADTFKKLGVDVKDSGGQLKNQAVIFEDVLRALAKVQNPTERAALAQKALGRGAQGLAPLIGEGTEALEEYLAVLEETGGAFDEDFLDATDKADKAFKKFDRTTDNLKARLAVAFLPALTTVIETIARWGGAFSKAIGNTNALKATLIVLGGVLLKVGIAKFGGQLLSLARTAALPLLKLALLVLILDDLITFFQGGDSVIGRALDKIFGAGTGSNVVQRLRGIWTALSEGDWEGAGEKILDALEAMGGHIVNALTPAFNDVATAARLFFGDDLPALIGEGVDAVLSSVAEWVSVGEALIDGLIEGIKAAAVELLTAVVPDIGLKAAQALRDAIQSKSPSKLFSAIGENDMGGGLVQGLERARARVAGAAGAMGGASAQATAAAGRGGPAAGSVVFQSDINLQLHGPASGENVAQLRQGLRQELADNRRATLAALEQVGG